MKLNLKMDITFQLIAVMDFIVAFSLDFYSQNLFSIIIFFAGLFFFVLGGLNPSPSTSNTSFNMYELVENRSNEWEIIKFSKAS